jgi:hypothetical protein
MAYSFEFRDGDMDKLSEDADKLIKECMTSYSFQASVPICFLGDGTYVFRIYPDRDSKGWPRLIKLVSIHSKIPIGERRKIRFWKDDRVNKLFDEAKQAGLEHLWGKPIYQYKSREQGYMMAYFYEVPEGQKYTQSGKAYGTILDKHSMAALYNLMLAVPPEDKRQLFDPANPAFGIKLSLKRAAGKSNVSCRIAMSKLTLPSLEFKDDEGNEIEYDGLDSIYIKETDKILDEDFFKLKQAVTEQINNFKAAGGKAVDKSAEGHKF